MYTQVLQYHVVPNQALKAAQLTNGQLLASELQNQPVKILKTSDNQIQVQGATGNPANIIFADVPVCKAVLHVIDAVLGPATSAESAVAIAPAAVAVASG
ncbi:hypothetical protein WJX84_002532 [Apatococcus fuscideae]|uniref:FAS1 domain-containing protein n=1 Tax=Apatococcus fuscideae TaxID=2026836 RepID=A0AAW1SV12_9CHLO